MASKKKRSASKKPDAGEALAKMERPGIKWKTVGLIGFGFVIVWGLVIGLIPWIGYVGVIGAGVLTAVAVGFGVYLWRLTRKSQGIVDILKTATDAEGRKDALERLEAKGKKGDAMNALARAQLLAQEKPGEAIRILEELDLKKTPALVQNDVRANLALLYLMNNRARDARALADDIRLDQQGQPKGKALYAAVVAESFARTGKAEDAKVLLETYDAADPEYGEVGAMLYRAQVYTFMATKNRGLAKKAMENLASIDPNMVAAFVLKGGNPQLAKMAKQVIQTSGAMPKQKMRMMRR